MLSHKIMGDCEIEFLNFNDPAAREVFWHSSAHILGYACEQFYKEPLLGVGPAIQNGFYYDFYSPTGQVVKEEKEYKQIERIIKKIVRQNLPFEAALASKEQALDMFEYNRFKTEIIENKVPDGSQVGIFKVGDFIDLCRGPHLPSTGLVKALKIEKNSQAYWLGDQERDSMQRIYGVSFPTR